MITKRLTERNDQHCVATVGFFDGVHAGHRYLIQELQNIAKSRGLPSAVVTFSQPPKAVVRPEFTPKLLTTNDEKLALLSNTGVDYCFILEFDKAMSQLSAQDFLKHILVEQLKVKHLLVGHDHRFGKDRSDSFGDYKRIANSIQMEVQQAPIYSPNGMKISATEIRTDIEAGCIANANRKLSHHYSLGGTVVEGFRIGRTMGFPTANIQPNNPFKLIPADGVYAIRVKLGTIIKNGMLNIGNRPTLDNGSNTSIEVNIFDFDGELYGQEIEIEFIDRIRTEKKFDSIELLKEQLNIDKQNALKILACLPSIPQ
jgi:riboflavin kinase / FMN adenylyltransferase